MIFILLVTAGLVMGVVVIHYESLVALSVFVARLPFPSRRKLLVAVLGALLAHLVEVTVFAAGYYFLCGSGRHGALVNRFDGTFNDCMYFSFVVYTSLGFGDIVPEGPLQFLVAVETLTGLLMIAWTASFIYVEMRERWYVQESGPK